MSAEKTTEPDEVLTDDELQAAAAPEQSIEEDDKPRKRTVVVAEDESVNRMDLVAMLEDSGYEVVGEAANGEEAVELTRKFRPSVVCMDVKMPRMDGIEAAGIICDENIAPVVMLTAFSQSDLVKKATGAGAMAYVTKPYEESKLLPALEVAMGRFAEINDLLDNVERSESKLHETEEQLKKAEEQLKKAEETLEERKLVDRAKGLLMDKADFSEQGAFRWIQKTSMDQRIPKKRLAMAIIAKYGDQKSESQRMSANTATVEGTTRGTLLVVDGHSLALPRFFCLARREFQYIRRSGDQRRLGLRHHAFAGDRRGASGSSCRRFRCQRRYLPQYDVAAVQRHARCGSRRSIDPAAVDSTDADGPWRHIHRKTWIRGR